LHDLTEGGAQPPPAKRQKTSETTEVPKFRSEQELDSKQTNVPSTSSTSANATAITSESSEGKKKKKQYKAKSSYIADDEFEDILATGWFYKDSNGDKQGPFTTKEMKEWFVAGFFDDDLLVKRIHETEFGAISERPDFKDLERRPQDQVYVPMSAFQAQQQLVTAPNPYYQDGPSFFDPAFEETPPAPAPPVPAPVVVEPEPETIARDYAQKAYFTTLKGRFSATDQESYWSMKGLPSDKDGRMLSNYFDYEAYQEQMRNAKPAEKKKVSKAQIKAFRKKKVDKKRRRILMM